MRVPDGRYPPRLCENATAAEGSSPRAFRSALIWAASGHRACPKAGHVEVILQIWAALAFSHRLRRKRPASCAGTRNAD